MSDPRVLVISYYFPPLTGAPAWRPYSWARFFSKMNLYPVVLTRHWTGLETSWDEHVLDIDQAKTVKRNADCTVIRVGSKKSNRYNLFSKGSNSFLSKLNVIFSFLIGDMNTEVDAFRTFKNEIKELLLNEKISSVIITGPPSNIYRLAKYIKKISSVLVIIDIRDLNNNQVLEKNYFPSIKQRFFDGCFNIYLSRWMKSADIITAVTPVFSSWLENWTDRPVHTIYNGFDDDLYDSVAFSKPENFTISLIGTVYKLQPYQLILDAVQSFLIECKDENIQVLFPGLMTDQFVGNEFKKTFEKDSRVKVSDRIDKLDAIRLTKEAHVLLFTAWPDRPGVIPAKIFDYIASENRIINCGPDGSISEEILTNSGLSVNAHTVEELKMQLMKEYMNFKGEGMNLNPNKAYIHSFARSEQAMRMAELIKQFNRS